MGHQVLGVKRAGLGVPSPASGGHPTGGPGHGGPCRWWQVPLSSSALFHQRQKGRWRGVVRDVTWEKWTELCNKHKWPRVSALPLSCSLNLVKFFYPSHLRFICKALPPGPLGCMAPSPGSQPLLGALIAILIRMIVMINKKQFF